MDCLCGRWCNLVEPISERKITTSAQSSHEVAPKDEQYRAKSEGILAIFSSVVVLVDIVQRNSNSYFFKAKC